MYLSPRFSKFLKDLDTGGGMHAEGISVLAGGQVQGGTLGLGQVAFLEWVLGEELGLGDVEATTNADAAEDKHGDHHGDGVVHDPGDTSLLHGGGGSTGGTGAALLGGEGGLGGGLGLGGGEGGLILLHGTAAHGIQAERIHALGHVLGQELQHTAAAGGRVLSIKRIANGNGGSDGGEGLVVVHLLHGHIFGEREPGGVGHRSSKVGTGTEGGVGTSSGDTSGLTDEDGLVGVEDIGGVGVRAGRIGVVVVTLGADHVDPLEEHLLGLGLHNSADNVVKSKVRRGGGREGGATLPVVEVGLGVSLEGGRDQDIGQLVLTEVLSPKGDDSLCVERTEQARIGLGGDALSRKVDGEGLVSNITASELNTNGPSLEVELTIIRVDRTLTRHEGDGTVLGLLSVGEGESNSVGVSVDLMGVAHGGDEVDGGTKGLVSIGGGLAGDGGDDTLEKDGTKVGVGVGLGDGHIKGTGGSVQTAVDAGVQGIAAVRVGDSHSDGSGTHGELAAGGRRCGVGQRGAGINGLGVVAGEAHRHGLAILGTGGQTRGGEVASQVGGGGIHNPDLLSALGDGVPVAGIILHIVVVDVLADGEHNAAALGGADVTIGRSGQEGRAGGHIIGGSEAPSVSGYTIVVGGQHNPLGLGFLDAVVYGRLNVILVGHSEVTPQGVARGIRTGVGHLVHVLGSESAGVAVGSGITMGSSSV